jgi:steroid 5-alpha reductase family enzyme
MGLEFVLFANLATILILLLILWCVSLSISNASIVDVFWGAGFVVVAWVSLVCGGQLVSRSLVLTSAVTLWGLRLAGYLGWRNIGKPEDYRYAAMRDRHGKRFPVVSLFTVFGLQGLLMWLIALPIQVGISQPLVLGTGQPQWFWSISMALGVTLWLTGLFFEGAGDYQLARFKADPANHGQVMNRGLWRYTRHPNYFGDFLVWWGFYLLAVTPSTWWWTIIGPLMMSFLLIRVSGVRLLENSLRRRVPGYEEYVLNTSSFFPLPPRRQRGIE